MAPSTSLFPHTYPSPSRICAARDRPGSTCGRVSARISEHADGGGGVQAGADRVAEDRRGRAEQPAEGRAEDARRAGRPASWSRSPGGAAGAGPASGRAALAVGWKNARAASEQGSQGEDRPEPAAERRSERQPDGGQELGQVAEGEDAAAVVPVGGLAGDEGEGEQREELGQADHPDRERGLRDGHGLGGRSRTPPSAMTTAWEPVARVPRNRPARNSAYGRRAHSDGESSGGSGG